MTACSDASAPLDRRVGARGSAGPQRCLHGLCLKVIVGGTSCEFPVQPALGSMLNQRRNASPATGPGTLILPRRCLQYVSACRSGDPAGCGRDTGGAFWPSSEYVNLNQDQWGGLKSINLMKWALLASCHPRAWFLLNRISQRKAGGIIPMCVLPFLLSSHRIRQIPGPGSRCITV